MSRIKVTAFDPSMTSWGICEGLVNLKTVEIEEVKLTLVKTESEKSKGVRKDSDDLRRARVVHKGMLEACKGAGVLISEIPFTDPRGYASANFNSGIVTGVLASCPIPLIQVFPQEVKQLITGSRHAAKEEIIEWAMATFPNANWLMRKFKGKMIPTSANEHLADAVAALYAGIRTDQFKQLLALMNSVKNAA